MTIRVISWNRFSRTGRELSRRLGGRFNHTETAPGIERGDVLINWGIGSARGTRILSAFAENRLLNHPTDVALSANKLSFFNQLSALGLEPMIPTFSESRADAIGWLQIGRKVVVRSVLNGHSGNGISIVSPNIDNEYPESILPNAPLYTIYFPKSEEYRVHFMRDTGNNVTFFDIQRKARLREVVAPNWEIRNLEGGFIYAREGIDVQDATVQNIINRASTCFEATGLYFGAVDVIQNARGAVRVLEVNTAPGLTGTTLEKYVSAFREIAGI